LGEAIGFIRRPRKSVFRQTGSKQQRRGRNIVFVKHRQRFSRCKAGGRQQNLRRHLLRHVQAPFRNFGVI
jgi:hypothetical protein